MLSICFPVITFIAVDVEKKFTMILLVFTSVRDNNLSLKAL